MGNTTSWGPIGDSSVSKQVDIGQLFESFKSEVLQNMPVDISSFITMSKVLCLPQGSSMTMDIDEKSSSILACPPKLGPLEMRDSCKITTGGSKSENEKVFGGAGISDSQRG